MAIQCAASATVSGQCWEAGIAMLLAYRISGAGVVRLLVESDIETSYSNCNCSVRERLWTTCGQPVGTEMPGVEGSQNKDSRQKKNVSLT